MLRRRSCSPLKQHRNRIMTAIIRQLQDAIAALRATAGRSYRTSFRMADFATFALRLADANGGRDVVEAIFARMGEEQDAFSLEGDSLAELLLQWLENPANHGRPVSAKDLYREFSSLSEQHGLDFSYKNSRSMGQRLGNVEHNLRSVARVQVDRDPHEKHKVYRFWPLVAGNAGNGFGRDSATANPQS